MQIRNEAERDVAVARVQELSGCLKHSAEERELEALADAIDDYDRTARTSQNANVGVRQPRTEHA